MKENDLTSVTEFIIHSRDLFKFYDLMDKTLTPCKASVSIWCKGKRLIKIYHEPQHRNHFVALRTLHFDAERVFITKNKALIKIKNNETHK